MSSLITKVSPKIYTNTDNPQFTIKKPVVSAPILMEIVFGRPSKDCQDIGICRINLLTERPACSKQQYNCKSKALAFVEQNHSGNLVFRFPKNQLNPRTIDTQFANNNFTVLETYILPEPLQKLFCPRLVVEKGAYPVQKEADYIVIEL